MMKPTLSGAVAAILLAACGGGSDSSTPVHSPTPVRTQPGTPEADFPPAKPDMSVKAPPLDTHAITVSSPSNHYTTDSVSMLVKNSGVSNLELTGNSNKVWISEGQAMNRIAVGGTSNTIVMMRGATVDSLTVSAGNTVYLPIGSAIDVLGGATVKYYAL